MSDHVIQVADGFWNIRGSFKIAGFVDIGTQASLVRRPSGRFLMLDSYPLRGAVETEILELTDGGQAVEAVLNLHPFHTIHVHTTHARFPHAKLYGTDRHVARRPELPWQPERTDGPEIRALFEELVFSVPAGVDFIPSDENLHFASVLAFHPSTRTLHVDDTLMYTRLPFMGGVRFHPTLGSVLQKRPGAVAEFRQWAAELVDRCSLVDHLCTAHTRALLDSEDSIAAQVQKALDAVRSTLDAHEKKHG
ncbi:MAG: hypothetical protein R3F61_22625 [Myxococcota bacterium]